MDTRYDRSRYFEMPKYFYFEAGNATVGSRNSFNYRIEPAGEEIKVEYWYGLICYAKAEILETVTFPFTKDGYLDIIYWLDERFDEYILKLESGEVEPRRTCTDEY